MCMWNTYLFTHVVSQNYVYFIIRWFFHEQLIQNSVIFPRFFHFYKFQELFKKFNDFSMILKQIWISMIFQELWEPCHSKTRWVDGTPTSEVTRSLSGRSLHLTLVTKRSRSHLTSKIQMSRSWPRSNPLVTFEVWSSIDMFAFRFVAIGPLLAEI